MARKAKTSEISVGGTLFDILKKVDDNIEVLDTAVNSNIPDYISTGSYILNACISGDMFKGVPVGRITVFSGASGCGKTYLACSCCREAQKKGYEVIYLDSENAMDRDFAIRLGCDPTKFYIKQVNTISETSNFILNLCKALEESEEKRKIIMILDSLGNLTSNKEREDTLIGQNKVDFTKAKDVKALFRTCTIPIAKQKIAFICINHVYQNVGSFIGGTVQASGSGILYNASCIINMTAAKLEDKDNDRVAAKKIGNENVKKNGVLVTATPEKSRFSIPRKVKFQIPYFKIPNPYIGIESYLTWENSGIGRGLCYSGVEYSKLSETEQGKCKEFSFSNNTLYYYPKETSRNIVVQHLGSEVSINEYFSNKVFTDEFLHRINDNIIKPLFELPTRPGLKDDINDLEEILDNQEES